MYDEVSVCVYIYRRNLFISLHKNLIYLCIRGKKMKKERYHLIVFQNRQENLTYYLYIIFQKINHISHNSK